MLLKIFLLRFTGGEILLNVLKQSGFIYIMLRDSINDSLLKGSFPDSLKLGNITPFHKEDEPAIPYYQKFLKD